MQELQEPEGSTAIARSATNPRWLASVHLHASKIPDEILASRSVEGVEVATPDRSVWEMNVIPHELRRLFGDQTFIWGGDLNTDPRMDDKPWFLGLGSESRPRPAFQGGGAAEFVGRLFKPRGPCRFSVPAVEGKACIVVMPETRMELIAPDGVPARASTR